MYKGNTREFIEKLAEYVERTYGLRLSYDRSGRHKDAWLFHANGRYLYPDSYAFDTEDFEEQVYRAVNWVLTVKGII